MSTESMKDIEKFCPHKDVIDAYCTKCNIYICKKCEVATHFDHIDQITGLDNIFSNAIRQYEAMGTTLEKHLVSSNTGIKDGAIDETLLQIEKKIGEEYDKLLKDIKGIEDEQAAVITGTTFLGKVQREKEELEGEEFKALSEYDKKLGTTISQLLGSIESEKYDTVANLLTEGAKQDLLNQAKSHEAFYAKQQKYLKQIEIIKDVKPKITYNSQTISDLVQIKGVHEEIVKLMQLDPKKGEFIAYYPIAKTAQKSELKTKLPLTKYAICTLEDDQLFICGGKRKQKDYSGQVYVYSDVNGTLTNKAYMLNERCSHGIANRKDMEIYVVGGENINGFLNSAEVYDIKTNSWKALPNLSEAKKNVSLCIFADKYLYAIGGSNANVLTTVEFLNLSDPKAWEKRVFTNFPDIEKCASLQIADNLLLIFGGKTGSKKTQTCFALDLAWNSIIPKAALPIAASFNKAVTKKISGFVYSTGNHKGKTFIYDITSNQWNTINEKDYTLKYSWT